MKGMKKGGKAGGKKGMQKNSDGGGRVVKPKGGSYK